MRKVKVIFFLILFLSLNLGCSIFEDEEDEKFQLIVFNLGNRTAVITVNNRYAGRAIPREKTLLGHYPQSKFTHLVANSEEGKPYLIVDQDTRNKETYEWVINAN